jgi:hypothetical protein
MPERSGVFAGQSHLNHGCRRDSGEMSRFEVPRLKPWATSEAKAPGSGAMAFTSSSAMALGSSLLFRGPAGRVSYAA